jgi:L-amino acid N-acyltransferase YncA
LSRRNTRQGERAGEGRDWECHPTIRLATTHDAAGVQAIYAPIVRDTAISFELEPPSVEEVRRRIEATLQRLPWLVCEHRSEILGYVYASQHRTRPAYQ